MSETFLRIARHLRLLLVTMLLVSFLTFLAFELVSGDPARTMLGIEATETQLSVLRHELGLDRPFLARYVLWLSLMSFLIITVISIPLGVFSYRWTGKTVDGLRTGFNQLCMAVPPFFTGILFSCIFIPQKSCPAF